MGRVIEKRNLAFNHSIYICDLCRRWGGEFTDTNIRVCKYNKDNKGLKSGLVVDQLYNYKCKYYKRAVQYYTSKLKWKNYRSEKDGKTTIVTYKRGRFISKKVD